MRIALVSTCALATPPKAYGGTELVVAELAKGLSQSGHDVTVFATGDSQPDASVRFHFHAPVWPPNELAELNHAAYAWSEIARAGRAFDVIHVHHHAAIPFHTLLGLPTVFTVHHARVEELVEHYATYPEVAYVAISARQAALSPEVPFARVVHHGLDGNSYAPGAGKGGYVAFLGRFAEEKAPHLAIDAARSADAPIRLGGAPHEVAREYFAREMEPRLALAGVDWCGELSHAPKLELLRNARALLVPVQWEEPFGLVIIEAMLVGTPVIGFAHGSVPEIVEEGVTGFLVDNVQQMAARIGGLSGFDRAACRRRALERFSHLRMARDYAELYAALLGRGRPLAPSATRNTRSNGGERRLRPKQTSDEPARVISITPELRARAEARKQSRDRALEPNGEGTSEEPWN